MRTEAQAALVLVTAERRLGLRSELWGFAGLSPRQAQPPAPGQCDPRWGNARRVQEACSQGRRVSWGRACQGPAGPPVFRGGGAGSWLLQRPQQEPVPEAAGQRLLAAVCSPCRRWAPHCQPWRLWVPFWDCKWAVWSSHPESFETGDTCTFN